MGTGCDTILAQIAAEVLECSTDDISVFGADTDISPYDSGSYASSTTYVTGKAVEKCALELRDRIEKLGAKMLGCEKCDVTFDGKKVICESGENKDKCVTLADISTASMCGNDIALSVTNTFSVVLFASALSAVHPSLYEYAALEGAGWWTQSFRITLPQIMPTAFLVFVLAWVNAFKIFKEVYFIGGAYPSNAIYTLQHFMNNKFARLEYQDVTTAAYIFAVGVMVLFALMYLSKAVRSPNN